MPTEKGPLVEIKKVTSKGSESREETLCRLGIYKRNEEKIVLNTNHKYFYQLQQQLFCSKYKQSPFAVSDEVWLNHELVEFNDGFCGRPLQELEKFYFQNILPELVYPRQPRWNKEIARLFTVPYFFVRSLRDRCETVYDGHLDFQMYRGGGRRGL